MTVLSMPSSRRRAPSVFLCHAARLRRRCGQHFDVGVSPHPLRSSPPLSSSLVLQLPSAFLCRVSPPGVMVTRNFKSAFAPAHMKNMGWHVDRKVPGTRCGGGRLSSFSPLCAGTSHAGTRACAELSAMADSHWRDCRFMAPPCNFIRCSNRDKQGVSSK